MNVSRAVRSLAENKIAYKEQEPLSAHTSFRIGGPAALAVFPRSCEEAVRALGLLREEGIRTMVLGNGTNVLFADEGFRGAVVILTGMKKIAFRDGLLYADAGVSLTHAAAEAAKRSLTGLEFAYGIPGTVGGGVYMNAGAYGGEMSQVVVQSCFYDSESGKCGTFEGEDHAFAYRQSAYMDSQKIVLSAAFRLREGDKGEIEARMADVMSCRREKQPLELPNAGSVFKRGNGFITAMLIEQAGLKGRRVGGAAVSEKHAGFIVNLGDATAADVRVLTEIVQTEILRQFGKTIEREIRYIEY